MSTMEFYILFVIVGFIIAILADSPFSISKERMKSIKEAANWGKDFVSILGIVESCNFER